MILGVLVKNLEATEKKRKVLQYSVNEDDDDEIKEISSKDKGKRVASGSGSTQTTLNQLLKKDIIILEKKHVDKLLDFSTPVKFRVLLIIFLPKV